MTPTTAGGAGDPATLSPDPRTTGMDRDRFAGDPLIQFRRWQQECESSSATAAVLATADVDCRPSVRWVDVVRVDSGFVFFTNHGSRKGAELSANPQAALCFGWLELGRQVQVRGRIRWLTDLDCDAYYGSLPRPVQLLVWASEQSRPVAGRAEVQAKLASADDRFAGQEIPRPGHWGGYRLIPDEVEFWQERSDRVQDRLRYRRPEPDAPWHIERLAP